MSNLPDRHLINEEMLDETARQIAKDLRLSNSIFNGMTGDSAFDQLHNALLPEVKKLIETNPSLLPQVLYQVDLPENFAEKAISSSSPAENLTSAIIKRCFQKAVLRRMYNSGKL